ncbi:MAG: hypothetical protein GTO05_17560, partial [Gemmatimonadales bacterium]|nr:hypothetical protein [Gemmatimonadales bacterium]
TRQEVADVMEFMAPNYDLVFDPLEPEQNLVPPALLNDFDHELYRQAEYRLYPATDDRPYFSFLRREFRA